MHRVNMNTRHRGKKKTCWSVCAEVLLVCSAVANFGKMYSVAEMNNQIKRQR